MAKIYGYPEIGRTGLGHSLLAWARCVVWCERHGFEMLAPRWLRVRTGPYLRRERDKREYFRYFTRAGLKGWPLRYPILAISEKTVSVQGKFAVDINSPEFIADIKTRKNTQVVIFDNALSDNEVKYFHTIYGQSKMLRQRFLAMVKPKFKSTGLARGHIAIHVRMGDFTVAYSTNDLTRNNMRLPITWYGAALKQLRNQLGVATEAIVFSDGTDEDLRLLLEMEGVQRAPKQDSVTDLLSISEASALIASGSGFSLWGGFLGQLPVLYFSGRKRVKSNDDQALEIEWAEGAIIPSAFIAGVAQRLPPVHPSDRDEPRKNA
jgi:hypothetical protein